MEASKWEALPAGYVIPNLYRLDSAGKQVPMTPQCEHAVNTAQGWSLDCMKPATHGRRYPNRAAAAPFVYDIYACGEHATEEAQP